MSRPQLHATSNTTYPEILGIQDSEVPDFVDELTRDAQADGVVEFARLPQRGFRGVVASPLSRLGIHLQPGRRERADIQLADLVRRSLIDDIGRPEVDQVVATFVSQNGGVGKTAITAYVSAIAAAFRPLARVVAVDGNPDMGILLPRLGGQVSEGSSLREFHTLAIAGQINTYADLVRVVANPKHRDLSGRPQNVAVIRSDPAHRRLDAFGTIEYVQSFDWLSRLANVVTNDCGTDLLAPLTEGALRCTNQLIYITDPTGVGLQLALDTLTTYASNPQIAPEDRGHFQRLVGNVIVVVNMYRDDNPLHQQWLGEAERLFPERVYCVPFDYGLADRRTVNFNQLQPYTVNSLLQLAAGMFRGAAMFANPQSIADHHTPEVAHVLPLQPALDRTQDGAVRASVTVPASTEVTQPVGLSAPIEPVHESELRRLPPAATQSMSFVEDGPPLM